MSSIHKFKSDEHNVENENRLNGFYNDKRVNVTDLVSKMKSEHKKRKKKQLYSYSGGNIGCYSFWDNIDTIKLRKFSVFLNIYKINP